MPLLLADVNGDALAQFGGRLHPMLLHLPIGLLVAVAALEVLALLRRKPLEQGTRTALAWFTALCAVITMISGLLLSREDSYNGDALQTHKLLGIGVATGTVLMAICASMPSRRKAYAILLLLTLIVTIPAGHIGGTMTHGEGFLTEPFAAGRDAGVRPRGTADDTTHVGANDGPFVAMIAPIINDRCLACHSDARRKGGLAMHTADALFAGSEAGPVIVPGDAAGSELILRLRLPLDDKAHMPPNGKPQPTEAEIAAIEQWINAGAPLDAGIGADESMPDDSNAESSADGPATDAPDSLAQAASPPPPPAPPAESLAALRAAQVHVELVEPQRGLLWVDFAAAPEMDDARAQALLAPLLEWIADVSFAGTHVGDGAAALAMRMPNLRSLDLSRTACTAAGVHALRGHPRIEELRLTQTTLDDTTIDSLASLPALKRVYLWNAGITPEAAGRLHAVNSELLVDVGAPAGAQPLETEGAIALSSDAAVPGAGLAPSASASLAPVNSACPVSGAAINPKFAIVHEGKVIAFCCQDCAAKFWADPAKFPLPK